MEKELVEARKNQMSEELIEAKETELKEHKRSWNPVIRRFTTG
jgi:hypothetical protein